MMLETAMRRAANGYTGTKRLTQTIGGGTALGASKDVGQDHSVRQAST